MNKRLKRFLIPLLSLMTGYLVAQNVFRWLSTD
jgi:hypothetical protein